MSVPAGDTFASLSRESRVALGVVAAIWVIIIVGKVFSWTWSVARSVGKVFSWIYNLFGFGYDEDEMLGIKHHKKGGKKSKSKSKSSKSKSKSGKGGKGNKAAGDDSASDTSEMPPLGVVQHRAPASSIVASKKPSKPHKKPHHAAEKNHPLHVNTLKGHTDAVNMVAFSGNGTTVVTACDDATVRVFRLDSAGATCKAPRTLRVPLGRDMATGACFANVAALDDPAATDGLVAMGTSGIGETRLVRFAISDAAGKPPEVRWEKKRAMDGETAISLSCGGGGEGLGVGGAPTRIPPVVVCSSDQTSVRVWAVDSGVEIGRIDTLQFKNHNAAISPDGNLIAVSTFTAEVKVWLVLRSRQGAPMGVDSKRAAMTLKGHRSAVHWVEFSPCSTRAVTVSKDKTLKLWNLAVRYEAGEDPKVLASVDLSDECGAGRMPTRVALSAAGVAAVMIGNSLIFYKLSHGLAGTSVKLERIDAPHGSSAAVKWTTWSPTPHAIDGDAVEVLATAGSDKRVSLWMSPR